MKRSDFLKKIGIGIGVAMVAPKILAEITAQEEKYDVIRTEPEYYYDFSDGKDINGDVDFEECPNEIKNQIKEQLSSFDGWIIAIHKENSCISKKDIVDIGRGYACVYSHEDNDYIYFKTRSL